MAPCRPRGCAQRRSGPDRACRRRFGHSGAASSRWRFLRVRRRQHDRRASFADPTCRPRASSLKTIGLILIRVRRASGTPRAGFLLCDQSPPEPFGNRCETSEWPILDGGTDGSNPVPSREESANHRFLSPHACDRRRRGQGEPFGAFQCGYQPGAAECCPPLGLPFPRRPTIVSRCCGRCSHGRARPNMAMRKRTRRAMWRGCAAPIPTASRHGPKRMRRASQRKERPCESRTGRWGSPQNQLLSDLPFRCEQRLGRLTRSGHPLAIIAARMRVLRRLSRFV